MAQRKSGYVRQNDELYETPDWPIDALAEHVQLEGLSIWEPCAASGQLARALERHTNSAVWITDLRADPQATTYTRTTGQDFLAATAPPTTEIEAIASNPPYGLGGRTAVAFIGQALTFMRRPKSKIRLIAFLLSVDFDSASTRTHLFADCPEFSLKVVLLRRIKWFEGPSGPSTNHCWMVWQRPTSSIVHVPAIAYAPRETRNASIDVADL